MESYRRMQAQPETKKIITDAPSLSQSTNTLPLEKKNRRSEGKNAA
jgi:hypothetical protein